MYMGGIAPTFVNLNRSLKQSRVRLVHWKWLRYLQISLQRFWERINANKTAMSMRYCICHTSDKIASKSFLFFPLPQFAMSFTANHLTWSCAKTAATAQTFKKCVGEYCRYFWVYFSLSCDPAAGAGSLHNHNSDRCSEEVFLKQAFPFFGPSQWGGIRTRQNGA